MSKRQKDSDWEAWVRQAIKERHLHEPPADVLHRALVEGSRLAERATERRWVFDLLFDSAAEPLPAGVRSASGVGQRRLLYQAKPQGSSPDVDACQLDLRLGREPAGTLEIIGQLLPPWSHARVVLTAGRDRRRETLGESGAFLFRNIPSKAGTFSLSIESDHGGLLELADVPLELYGSEPS